MLKRNKSLRVYRANYADTKARARRLSNAFTIIGDVWDWLTDKLKESLCPEKIAGFHVFFQARYVMIMAIFLTAKAIYKTSQLIPQVIAITLMRFLMVTNQEYITANFKYV